jgi:predicted acyltransferase
MSTTTITHPQDISIDGTGESILTRVQSIDIFRGITQAVMIFVHGSRQFEGRDTHLRGHFAGAAGCGVAGLP